MDRKKLLDVLAPLSVAIVLGKGWMAGLWPRAEEPDDLVEHINVESLKLLKTIVAEKQLSHPLPFLPSGRFVCHNCQGEISVLSMFPSPFLYVLAHTEVLMQTTCDTGCTNLEWQFTFPDGWDGGPNFEASVTITKDRDWLF